MIILSGDYKYQQILFILDAKLGLLAIYVTNDQDLIT